MQAKTGTGVSFEFLTVRHANNPCQGKTTAFLLPAIERLVSSRSTSSSVGQILVLAPTRELVLQIEEEAKLLLAHHPYGVQCVIGGTKCAPPPVLVAYTKMDVLQYKH